MTSRVSVRAAVGIFMSVVLSMPGCAKTSRTPLMEELSPEELSAQELRTRLYGAVDRFNRLISNNADVIRFGTDDRLVHETALRWKLFATANMTAAAFRVDPLFGFIDSWSFATQMQIAMSPGGALDEIFGEYQTIAIDATAAGEALFSGVAPVMLRDTADARQVLTDWALAHPIGDLRVGRASILESDQTVVSQYRTSAFGVGEMQATLEDMNARMPLLLENGIRQSLWRIELMLAERGIEGAVDSIVNDVASIDLAAVRVAEGIESLDRRVALLDSLAFLIERERVEVLGEVDRQRHETLDALTDERIAVLDAIDTRFETVLSTLLAERAIVMAEVDSIADGKIELATVGLIDIVDHAFWRALQFLGVAALLALVIGWLLLRRRATT